MLKIRHLSKTFYQRNSEKPVIKDISLTVGKGQVFGFLGLNGAGKTTTVKTIIGLLFPDVGQIKIGRHDSQSLMAKKIIGFMPESPQFYGHLNAREVLQYVGQLFELEPSELTTRITQLLREVGLPDVGNLPVSKFSKGMTQRLGFAVALINDPELLILDEPLDGLDPVGRIDIKRLLLRLKKQKKTIFLSSHILSDVEEICDQIAILHQGRIICEGQPKTLIGRSQKSLEEFFVDKVRAVKG